MLYLMLPLHETARQDIPEQPGHGPGRKHQEPPGMDILADHAQPYAQHETTCQTADHTRCQPQDENVFA